MTFHTEYLTFKTQRQREDVNITREVEAALKKSGIRAEFDGQRAKRVVIKVMGE
jgi:thiamine phosphate synthase YjbQ (UPF0047 family)